MILIINAQKQGEVSVSLKDKGKIIYTLTKENQFGSQILLKMIKKILEKNNLELKDLEEIETSVGPGSFTGLRVGASIANALGYSLKIPVNGKKSEVDLKYS